MKLFRFSKHDQIGEVRIPLNTIDLAQTIEEWRNLTRVETDGGQVSKSMKFLSSKVQIYMIAPGVQSPSSLESRILQAP